jgi:tryptophan synthase beta chain
VAHGIKLARQYPKDGLVLVNLSGRGDKDVHTVAKRESISL